MDPLSITAIVLASLSLASSVLGPLILASAYFINRIKKSDCLGAHIELTEPNLNPPVNLESNQPMPTVTPSFINKIQGLIKK
jgi:hypothetical protein